MERAAVAAEAWPSIESGSVKEESDGGGWQLFFRILEKLGVGEKFSCPVVPCAGARSLPLSPKE